MMLAGASVFWVVFGALSTPVAAAGLTLHSESAAAAGDPDPSGGTDHHCRGQSFNHPGDDDRCCKQKCCASPPHPTRRPVPTATPTSIPKRGAPPPQRLLPRPAAAVAPHPSASPKPSASPAPASTSEPAAGPQPPVLAPPALTIPALLPASTSKSGGGAVTLIAFSSVLVAATVAVASLALIRRSS